MNKAILGLIPLAILAGCEQQATDAGQVEPGNQSAEAGNGATMGNMAMPTASKTAKGTGTVTALDQKASKITLKHGPLPEANWPAMTMSFKLANPSSVSGIEPGQRVDFQFTIAGGMDATVTEIKRVE